MTMAVAAYPFPTENNATSANRLNTPCASIAGHSDADFNRNQHNAAASNIRFGKAYH